MEWRREEPGGVGIDRAYKGIQGYTRYGISVDLREVTKLAGPSVPREGHWRQEGGVTQALTQELVLQE